MYAYILEDFGLGTRLCAQAFAEDNFEYCISIHFPHISIRNLVTCTHIGWNLLYTKTISKFLTESVSVLHINLYELTFNIERFTHCILVYAMPYIQII